MDNLFKLLSHIYNCFILLSNLHVIVSEFYDLDVGTVKWIEIQPERLRTAPDSRAGWNLKQVTWQCVLFKFAHNLEQVLFSIS